MKLTAPLGEDALFLVSLSGSEQISSLFQFELNTVWQNRNPMVFKDLLGKSVTAELDLHDSTRYINGIVKSITQSANSREHELTWYYLTVVPTMWLLTRNVNCRIFQKMKVPDIVEQVLNDAGLTDLEIKLQNS